MCLMDSGQGRLYYGFPDTSDIQNPMITFINNAIINSSFYTGDGNIGLGSDWDRAVEIPSYASLAFNLTTNGATRQLGAGGGWLQNGGVPFAGFVGARDTVNHMYIGLADPTNFGNVGSIPIMGNPTGGYVIMVDDSNGINLNTPHTSYNFTDNGIYISNYRLTNSAGNTGDVLTFDAGAQTATWQAPTRGGGSDSVLLQTNGVDNGNQHQLNLISGSNITITNSGGAGGDVIIDANLTVQAAGSPSQIQYNASGSLHADTSLWYTDGAGVAPELNVLNPINGKGTINTRSLVTHNTVGGAVNIEANDLSSTDYTLHMPIQGDLSIQGQVLGTDSVAGPTGHDIYMRWKPLSPIVNGSVATVRHADTTGLTANDTIVSFTVNASDATFQINSYLNVTAFTSASIGLFAEFMDIHGTTQVNQIGGDGNGVSFQTLPTVTIRAQALSQVKIFTNVSGSTTYDLGVNIIQPY